MKLQTIRWVGGQKSLKIANVIGKEPLDRLKLRSFKRIGIFKIDIVITKILMYYLCAYKGLLTNYVCNFQLFLTTHPPNSL